MVACLFISFVFLAVVGANPARFRTGQVVESITSLDGDNVVSKKVLGENYARQKVARKIRTRSIESMQVRTTTGFFQAFAAPAGMQVTDNVFPLISQPGTSLSQRFLQVGEPEYVFESETGESRIKNINNTVYLTPIKFGDQSFMNVIDTGSADTWVVGSSLRCVDPDTKNEVVPEACKFAKPYVPTKSLVRIPDQHFNISYASGEFLNGAMAKETVTLGNLSVPNQEFGIIDYAKWRGDEVSSGLVGLAFPSITRAFPGNDPRADKRGSNVPYNPIFTNMWKQNLTAPVFSLALNRANEAPGVIAFGGLPGGDFKFKKEFATARLQYSQLNIVPKAPVAGSAPKPAPPVGPQEYQLYSIDVDGWSVKGKGGTAPEVATIKDTKVQVVMDSGTTLSYLPPEIAYAINKAWNPPGMNLGPFYAVWCNATPPVAGLRINGTMISFDSADLLLSIGPDQKIPLCISSIQATGIGGPRVPILGGAFLRGVVAVFDIGAAQMRLANRVR